jgi:hypothetical protein
MSVRSTEELLQERQKTHGDYSEHARCTQSIMRALMRERNWDLLPDIMKESLHMFAHKAGRIVTGDPYIPDHWDDTCGYAKLVSQKLADGTCQRPPEPVPGTGNPRPGTPEDGGQHSKFEPLYHIQGFETISRTGVNTDILSELDAYIDRQAQNRG